MKTNAPKISEEQKQKLAELLRVERERKLAVERRQYNAIRIIQVTLFANLVLMVIALAILVIK